MPRRCVCREENPEMKISQVVSRVVFRNLVLLTLMGWLLFASASRDGLANVLTPSSCRDTKIGPATAMCVNVSACTPGDFEPFVFVWIGNSTVCPGYAPPVVDSVATDARVGDPGLVSTARSVAVGGPIIALGFAFAQC